MTDIATVVAGWVEKTIGLEGAYSFDPNDSGGETMWGVTAVDARAHGYTGAMSAMPRETAVTIYLAQYVTDPQIDRLAAIDEPLAYRMFDLGVNNGPMTAGKFLQTALNVLNNQGVDFSDLVVDGNCFTKTRVALSAFIGKRGLDGQIVLLGMVVAQASARYIALAVASPKNETFEYGWQLNRAVGLAIQS